MTEAEWLTSTDPSAMLRSLVARYSARRRRGESTDFETLRLFACACLRRIPGLLDADQLRAVKMIEDYVWSPTPDGRLSARRVGRAAGNRAGIEYDRVSRAVPRDRRACLIAWARNIASSAVWQAADKNPATAANSHRQVAEAVHAMRLAEGAAANGPDPGYIGYRLPPGGELIAQATILREIVGNPFADETTAEERSPA